MGAEDQVHYQTVSETVLCTVLIEVVGILNSKPLGYLSPDIADYPEFLSDGPAETLHSLKPCTLTAISLGNTTATFGLDFLVVGSTEPSPQREMETGD